MACPADDAADRSLPKLQAISSARPDSGNRAAEKPMPDATATVPFTPVVLSYRFRRPPVARPLSKKPASDRVFQNFATYFQIFAIGGFRHGILRITIDFGIGEAVCFQIDGAIIHNQIVMHFVRVSENLGYIFDVQRKSRSCRVVYRGGYIISDCQLADGGSRTLASPPVACRQHV